MPLAKDGILFWISSCALQARGHKVGIDSAFRMAANPLLQRKIMRYSKCPPCQVRSRAFGPEMPEESKEDLLDDVLGIVRVQAEGDCITPQPDSKLIVQVKYLLLQNAQSRLAFYRERRFKASIGTVRHRAAS